MCVEKNIIFHIPWKLRLNRASASQIRPQRMLDAFYDSGYQVDVVMGNETEKIKAIKTIRQRINNGKTYDFCYSESSTGPTLIANGWKETLRYGNSDFSFFRMLKKNKIPIGLFYRDIYWMFDEYMKSHGQFKRIALPILHKYDVKKYKKYVDILYLPSLRMKPYIKDFTGKTEALPPGSEIMHIKQKIKKESCGIKLIYVGGVTNQYGLMDMIKCMGKIDEKISLNICARKSEWSIRKDYQELVKEKNISVNHVSDRDLAKMYYDSNIGMLFFENVEYWTFAMPYKLFEYIGYGMPVIATEGTAAGDFVKDNQIGWTIPYGSSHLKKLLSDLLVDNNELIKATRNVKRVRDKHSWSRRAEYVAKSLSGIT